MRSSLQVGDEIVTIGGICGKIVKTKDETIVIQVGADKVKFEMMRWSVSSVTNPSHKPRKDEAAAVEEEEAKKVKPKNSKDLLLLKKLLRNSQYRTSLQRTKYRPKMTTPRKQLLQSRSKLKNKDTGHSKNKPLPLQVNGFVFSCCNGIYLLLACRYAKKVVQYNVN